MEDVRNTNADEAGMPQDGSTNPENHENPKIPTDVKEHVEHTPAEINKEPSIENMDNSATADSAFKKPIVFAGVRPAFKRPDKKNIFDSTIKKTPKVEPPVNKPSEENRDGVTGPKPAPNPKTPSPAEQLKQAAQPTPYKEPPWSGIPDKEYYFEVLKNGSIIDKIKLSDRPYFVIGRLQSCDVTMDHPTLSRYHAAVQYCDKPSEERSAGWYIYDMDSTHGTWVNKNRLKEEEYVRIRVGHVVKFGGSTRLNVLQGPPDDQDAESELSISEMKELRSKQKRELEILKQAELEAFEEKKRWIEQAQADKGCSWGMDEAEQQEGEVNPDEENPFRLETLAEREELYINDPKKALNGFFEREGLELPEYGFEDAGHGKHKCFIELPIDDVNGRPLMLEVTVTGKKKEAVVACALESCRILDKHGVLRAATHESRKRKKKDWEQDDFYDSDEDTFLDRTGTIEKKRVERMKKAGKVDEKSETYDGLVAKLHDVQKEILELQSKLDKAKADAANMDADELDALDAYMTSIKSGAMDTSTKMRLKREIFDLKKEEQKLTRLVNLVKPPDVPAPRKYVPPVVQPSEAKETKCDSMKKVAENNETTITSTVTAKPTATVGKMKRPVKGPAPPPATVNITEENSENIVEEDDDETDKTMETDTVPERVSMETNTETTADIDAESNLETESKPDSKSENTELLKEKTKKSRKRIRKPQVNETNSASYAENDPDYAVWVPPENQSGDGSTHLNAKFGY